MTPPLKLDPLFDKHGGFTVEISSRNIGTSTLWRPGQVAPTTETTLQAYNEQSFWQLNNNVTRAVYKLRRYRYPVVAWFDNTTGERIA